MTEDIIAGLLALAVLFCWIGAAGIVIARGALAKLHFTSLAGSLAIPATCLALAVRHGFHHVTVKAVLLAVFSIFTNAVLTHATGRAIRVSHRGDWRSGPGEEVTELEAG